MPEPIIRAPANDDDRKTFHEWAKELRVAAANKDIDPSLARAARDIARSLDALGAAFRAALKG